MKKQTIYKEFFHAMGENEYFKILNDAQTHRALFQGITESLLFGREQNERMDMAFLSKISEFDYGKKHRVLVIGFEESSKTEDLARIRKVLFEQFDIFLVAQWRKTILCILPEKMSEPRQISVVYHQIEQINSSVKIAGSTVKEALEECHNGLAEALRTFDMIETMKPHEENLMFYEDLGIFRVLYNLQDYSAFESYYHDIFQSLWQYDEKNESHLFETLESYFRNEYDKKKTSEELYIHENTLRYRLHQIEDILGRDLNNINVIADIVTAFKVRRLVQILDKV